MADLTKLSADKVEDRVNTAGGSFEVLVKYTVILIFVGMGAQNLFCGCAFNLFSSHFLKL